MGSEKPNFHRLAPLFFIPTSKCEGVFLGNHDDGRATRRDLGGMVEGLFSARDLFAPLPEYGDREMRNGPVVQSALTEATLEALLRGYQEADAHATRELICRLSPDLLRFFLAQETTKTEAEDLLQNAWLRIHKARHTYRSGAPVLPWVFAIAKHVRVDGYRKRRRMR